MIEEAPGPIDLAYFQQMQGDNKDLVAEGVAPVLLTVSFEDDELKDILDMLDGWDYQDHMDSPEAALFNVFWKHMLLETFDELPEEMAPGGGDYWYNVLRQEMLYDPANAWWDILDTEEVETRDDIFRMAFAAAVKELKKELGKDPEKWRWGGLHTFTLTHGVMSNFPFINKAFERGPFEVSGGPGIVNAVGWSTGGDTYEVGESGVPSMRMIVDLSDLANSWVILPTGQSGHAGHPHYIDMIDMWRLIEYVPMYWDLDDWNRNTEGHLQLVP